MFTVKESQEKKLAAIVIILSLAAFSFAVVVTAMTYARVAEPTSFRSFSVTAEGKGVIVPDVAQFTFNVITEGGKDVANLQQNNTKTVNGILDYLKNQGVRPEDIRTQRYNVFPRYSYFDCSRFGGVCPPPEITGYTVDQSVQVKARDFVKAGELLGGVVTKGANSVSELLFTIDDKTSVENTARLEAIAKAKIKAQSLATVGGFRLGRLLSISENQAGNLETMYGLKSGDGLGGGGDIAPSIAPGSQEIFSTVTLTYEIK